MIPQFCLRLICGMSATWCFMPRNEVTCGFFRIQMLVTLGLSILAALMVPGADAASARPSLLAPQTLQGISVAIAAASFLGSVVWTLARRNAGGWLAAAVLILSLSSLIGALPRSIFDSPKAAFLPVASELAAAGIFGASVTAMLLGHWYLTAPMMKLTPLQALNRNFAIAAAARGVLAIAAAMTLATSSLSGTQTVWLGMRWACGILAPLLLTFLVVRILRYRNTQSATGVLFAAVVLVFIGETTAAVLSRDLHWPL